MAHIWEDQNSRRIFQFLTINFCFMFVEIAVGFMSNSLGLISDAGHMFFDNASLFIGLYASYMARWRPDSRYTYGYARYEVLAGFVNAIFLVFVAISVVMEALERLWEPPEIRGDHLLVVSVGGLLVNILGLIFFHDVAHAHGGHGHGGGGGECSGHSHGGTNENMMGVYLHVLADALGSVGVIISSLLIQWYGWHLADPITSIIISFMILVTAGPLITATIGPLLSRTPEHLEAPLREALGAVERMPEVLGATQPHFWKHHADYLVGSLHVTIAPGSDRQKVTAKILALFNELGIVRGPICFCTGVAVACPPAPPTPPHSLTHALTHTRTPTLEITEKHDASGRVHQRR
jgi:zinc transporter 5/7